ncbi:MAG: sugar nucleotide-binding protein [bacterium]|nr:sugar nucleotide-binding protein [bacterium]
MNNQVVITGASGLLGSQLAQTFKDKKYEALAVFNQKPELMTSGMEAVKCDISSRDEVMSLKSKIKSSSLIIHCAAITDVDLCEKDKNLCSSVNIEGTKNICELANKNKSQLIYISTSSVFDGKIGNYKETDKPNPVNYYNLSKVEGEKIVLKYEKGIAVRMIHLGLHLASRKPASFFEWLVDSFKNNRDISLFNDVRVNPLSVSTMAKLIFKIPAVTDKGLLHLGSCDVVSKADIGREVLKFFPKYSGKVNFISMDDNKQKLTNRPKEMWLNVDKALSLGFDLPEALPDLNKYLHGKKLL